MNAKTKAKVTEAQVREMAGVAGLGPLLSIRELTGGEFNLAYTLETADGRYVLKIGPNACAPVLSYERGIMDVEISAYRMIAEQTSIPVPEILHVGREVVGNQWFVMAELPGTLFSEAGLDEAATRRFYRQYGGYVAQLHRIRGSRYGYAQLPGQKNWKDAYYEMMYTLLDDGAQQGLVWPGCAGILRHVRRLDWALDEVRHATLVHYDLFDNNVFTDPDGNFTGFIDTERSLWGDFAADFVAIAPMGGFYEKTDFIAGYNEAAAEKIESTTGFRARISLMRLYLGCLMFTEGTTRLGLEDPTHWERKHLGSQIIHAALHELDDI